jgi:hypothetical protein
MFGFPIRTQAHTQSLTFCGYATTYGDVRIMIFQIGLSLTHPGELVQAGDFHQGILTRVHNTSKAR